jgi:hypothetical protein
MDTFENEEATKLLLRLKRQEILLESFKKHINKILKQIKKGECNFLLINQLSHFIIYYYKKNLISLDDESDESDEEKEEESDKEKEEESDKEKEEEIDKKESDKEEKEESDKEESDKEEEEEENDKKQNQDILFNHFMNNSNLKKKSLFNPNYDIYENIKIFIRNSLVY